MAKIDHPVCTECGAKIPVDNISAMCDEDEGVLFVRYAPAFTKVVLVNSESGVKHVVTLPGREQPPKLASRQIGGIIGPY